MKFALILSLLLTSTFTFSQTNYTLSGSIKDNTSGEDIIGARVTVAEIPGKGALTNVYGFYSLTLPAGEYTVSYQFIGYKQVVKKINLNDNFTQNLELVPSAEMLQEVEVTAEKLGENLKTTEMGVEKINVKDIESIPVLFGEQDVLKTMQLLPGVNSAGEGNAGFYVRGGGADQNLILLDGAPVYNASHLLGFFSVFNSDALKDVKLYKGAPPAEFGGRLSSVMDIKMKEGNSKKFSASGGIGLISSRLTLEAPIVKDKGSFIISGRRTYVDQFLRFSDNENLDGAGLFFYDFNAKANYRISEKDRIFVSAYSGRDQFKFGSNLQFDWGNITSTARWNHIYNGKLFGNATFVFSRYDYKIGIGEGPNKVEIGSRIQDFNFKKDFDYFINSNNTLKFGGNIIHHTFTPGDIDVGEGLGFTIDDIPPKYSLESALYVSNDQKVGNRLNLTYGLRYNNFTQIGPGETFDFADDGSVIDTNFFDPLENVVTYHGLSPRLAVNYIVNEVSSVKASYSRTYQFMHLISNSTAALPTDIWLPSSPIIKPQIADQYSLGYFRNFKNNTIEFSAEAYYKDFQNVIDFRDGAEITLNPNVEGQLLFGIGRAYGVELLAKKKVGKFTGWVSYTLSKTENKIEGINDFTWFSAKQDRTHDVSVVLMYKLNNRLDFSASWVYYTGNAVTFPSGKYEINGQVINEFTERNGYRMPDYHRLDLGITLKSKSTKIITDAENNQIEVPRKFESSWNFSVYNAYGRENAYSITFQENEVTGATEAVQLALFKFIPSVTYNFKF